MDYRLASALRGPDIFRCPPLRRLKHTLTERLRHIAYPNWAEVHGDYCCGPLGAQELQDMREDCRTETLCALQVHEREAAWHLICHLQDAFSLPEVQEHPVWGGYAPNIIAWLAIARATVAL